MYKKKIAAITAASALLCTTAWLNTSAYEDIPTEKSLTITCGDINTDGRVTGTDIVCFIHAFLNSEVREKGDKNFHKENADLDGNGKIELTELATLKQYLTGDRVSIRGRAFSNDKIKLENNLIVRTENKLIIPFDLDELLSTEIYGQTAYIAANYDDACTRMRELKLDSYIKDYFDKQNFEGSPIYDENCTTGAFLIAVLRNTGDVTLWADPDGLDFQTFEADSDSVVVIPLHKDVFAHLNSSLGTPAESSLINFTMNRNTYVTNLENYLSGTGLPITDTTTVTPVTLKPVIYLYPEAETDVHVELEYSGKLTCTYPKYGENGWDVTAKPDSTLTDKDGNEYSYLFWDGYDTIPWDMSEGFVVKGEDTASFLREKLSYMGLTPREYNEFIVFWLPRMENNEYNLITFQQELYTENAKLDITPAPDSMQRVFMAYKALDEYTDIPEQELPTFERKGFSVVEWGGTEVK